MASSKPPMTERTTTMARTPKPIPTTEIRAMVFTTELFPEPNIYLKIKRRSNMSYLNQSLGLAVNDLTKTVFEDLPEAMVLLVVIFQRKAEALNELLRG